MTSVSTYYLVGYCIFTVGFTVCLLVPFARKRRRAVWAKFVFAGVGIVGLAYSAAYAAYIQRWLVFPSPTDAVFANRLQFVRGLLMGLLLALVFSGEALGKKIASIKEPGSNQSLEPTTDQQ